MIKDDVKSGVSVPETLKPTKTKTSSASKPQGIDPGIQEQALAKPTKPLTGVFPGLVVYFAKHGAQLYRTDWRAGPVTHFAIKNQQVRHISTLSELGLVLWAWGDNHG
jgi:hypothetical protein